MGVHLHIIHIFVNDYSLVLLAFGPIILWLWATYPICHVPWAKEW